MGEGVIDELLDCLELYIQGEEQQLRKRITEEAYFRNFVSLAQNIEPDGRKVNVVGFTAVRSGNPKEVQLTHTIRDGSALLPKDVKSPPARKKSDEETV